MKKIKASQDFLKMFALHLNEALNIAGAPPKHEGRQYYVAKLMGVTRRGAAKWLEGKGLPRPAEQMRLAAKLNVRLEWLIFNLGPREQFLTLETIILSVNKAVETVCTETDSKTRARLAATIYALLKEHL